MAEGGLEDRELWGFTCPTIPCLNLSIGHMDTASSEVVGCKNYRPDGKNY